MKRIIKSNKGKQRTIFPVVLVLLFGASVFQSCSQSNASDIKSCGPKSACESKESSKLNIMSTDTAELTIEEMLALLPSEFRNLDENQKKISLGIYHLMKKGEPVSFEQVASHTSIKRKEVEKTIKSWPGVFLDDNDDIMGYWGLSVKDYGHDIFVNGQPLYVWCAWDALFIPQLLGEETKIITEDHTTKKKMEIVVNAEGDLVSYPKGMTMSLLLPDSEKTNEEICADVVGNFCHYIFFFEDEASGKKFTTKHKNTVLLPITKAIELSKHKNKVQYGDMLKSI